MKIFFSNHVLTKIEILKQHGIEIEKEFIEEIVEDPEKLEAGYKNRLVAQKRLDESHVLRVVYEKYSDYLLIITIYPGRIKRYD
ncbi:MAG: DUF4258 domain-containing protein [Ignavibacteria bacterium]|nr:DUF4258 domain-containing protein [Ignavibacteria bacterium]